MKDIKAYKPATSSIGSGQVLHQPYTFDKARLAVREMTDMLVLDLVDKGLVTDQIVLTVGYDIENLTDPERRKKYKGPVTTDYYGRRIPKHAHGTVNLKGYSSSTKEIMEAVTAAYDRLVDKELLIRRLNISASHVIHEADAVKEGMQDGEQLDFFTDQKAAEKQRIEEKEQLKAEKDIQKALLDIKKKFGKNAILKGMNLEEDATARSKNSQIGGHKA